MKPCVYCKNIFLTQRFSEFYLQRIILITFDGLLSENVVKNKRQHVV